jgi:hypothetical protein
MQRGALFGPRHERRIGRGQFHSRLRREFLYCVDEGEAVLFGQPADRIAMRLAAEAMVEALGVVDEEAG